MPDIGMTGGGKLELYLRRIAEHAGPPREVHVGFLAGSTEADGTSLPMIAAIQEFGAPAAGIPPRPFFRAMIAKHKGEWGDQLGKVLVAQDYDGAAALASMGNVIGDELRESINELTAPPLSPVTLMLRSMRVGKTGDEVTFSMVQEARARVAAGEVPKMTPTGAKPLIDSGTMFNSVDSEVVAS